jgi:hypothetical protein
LPIALRDSASTTCAGAPNGSVTVSDMDAVLLASATADGNPALSAQSEL